MDRARNRAAGQFGSVTNIDKGDIARSHLRLDLIRRQILDAGLCLLNQLRSSLAHGSPRELVGFQANGVAASCRPGSAKAVSVGGQLPSHAPYILPAYPLFPRLVSHDQIGIAQV